MFERFTGRAAQKVLAQEAEALRMKNDALAREVEALRAEIGTMLAGHPHQWYNGVTYSQHGEDVVIVDMFHRLGIFRPTYLDVGAHHPTVISNTALLYARGCRGVNVDAHPGAIAEFRKARPEDKSLNLGVGPVPGSLSFYLYDGEAAGRSTFSRQAIDEMLAMYPGMNPPEEITIQVVTLDELVAEHCNNVYPDFLSIDAEYLDVAILRSASFQPTRPKVVCVEVHTPAGDSTLEVINTLVPKGFTPYVRMGGNILMIDSHLLPTLSAWTKTAG